MKIDEEQILKLLGDASSCKQGFSLLVARYSEPLYWKIRHVVLDHDDADDILQNTFLKAWNNLDRFEGRSSLLTWLYRIAYNEALDFLRRQKKFSTIGNSMDESVAERLLADEYFDGDETQARLQAAVAGLPEVQRAVFTMRYFEEMKYSQISQILGTSEGALKASYHLAVKKIVDYFHMKD
ncbi:sigma-70 family RNA polymerase sigma factor [Prevotella sp. A2931]|uniref:RNA polymerase sigma factor n=1 Tax=Prevotella illustrans TaxID=2800387 RepID=A0ABS3M3L5_9BACT|nr:MULTISPECIES: sigma-70 family RNA polymerase sigma factor [Prevotella]MBO1362758.1 sigma-70 family RNA polymerase sigma factor [Prevotella illustrans]PTL25751.1 RNA polymerase subunit sigma-70 [Prevotella sp. oral taxon 820]